MGNVPSAAGASSASMPNLIIVGGLKCGTTSIHHYLGLHPEINMSKPKELNFFVAGAQLGPGAALVRGPLR